MAVASRERRKAARTARSAGSGSGGGGGGGGGSTPMARRSTMKSRPAACKRSIPSTVPPGGRITIGCVVSWSWLGPRQVIANAGSPARLAVRMRDRSSLCAPSAVATACTSSIPIETCSPAATSPSATVGGCVTHSEVRRSSMRSAASSLSARETGPPSTRAPARLAPQSASSTAGGGDATGGARATSSASAAAAAASAAPSSRDSASMSEWRVHSVGSSERPTGRHTDTAPNTSRGGDARARRSNDGEPPSTVGAGATLTRTVASAARAASCAAASIVSPPYSCCCAGSSATKAPAPTSCGAVTATRTRETRASIAAPTRGPALAPTPPICGSSGAPLTARLSGPASSCSNCCALDSRTNLAPSNRASNSSRAAAAVSAGSNRLGGGAGPASAAASMLRSASP
mmetsp:Transcript_21367/g.68961  ORF Transcript_21367/g.68961 Transcript_21367/m.68961 type:complete len:404 (-) Transcript_21367:105-1316(-)